MRYYFCSAFRQVFNFFRFQFSIVISSGWFINYWFLISDFWFLNVKPSLVVASSDCPAGWYDTSIADLGCLWFGNVTQTWYEAPDLCNSVQAGAGLLEIRSPEESISCHEINQSDPLFSNWNISAPSWSSWRPRWEEKPGDILVGEMFVLSGRPTFLVGGRLGYFSGGRLGLDLQRGDGGGLHLGLQSTWQPHRIRLSPTSPPSRVQGLWQPLHRSLWSNLSVPALNNYRIDSNFIIDLE